MTTNKAVFLSYASQDADAAQRICHALRAAGIEVWFDQSELVGGDAWDQKIRGKIKTCALFVPIISASTQARREGYFRLEWKLAAQRTHTIADGTPFLLPVVIDPTSDTDALVPEEFRSVQWTRLAGGEASPAFVARVSNLLTEPAAKLVTAALASPASRLAPQREAHRVPHRTPALLVALVVLLLGLGSYMAWRSAARGPAATQPPQLIAQATTASSPAPGSGSLALQSASDKSIAVLPFANMSDDRDANAFFADGIHEDIVTNLALLRELRVVSRTSVLGFRGTTKKIGDVARELGVSYILEGSVRRAGNKVRVTGQLIRAATDEHLWAKSYDRDLTDIFLIQAALAQEIARALKLALSPEERSMVGRQPTQNPAAYELYVKARTSGALNRAVWERRNVLFEAAVELDPNFAEAWARLGAMHAAGFYYGYDTSTVRQGKAKLALARALKLAPDVPEVMRDVAMFYSFNWDYGRALHEAQRLVDLQPNLWSGYTTLSNIQQLQGRWSEALANASKGVHLDTRNTYAIRILARHLQYCRRFAEAEREQQRVVTLAPEARYDAIPAHLRFLADGSARDWEKLLAGFDREETEMPRVIELRKEWAARMGNFAEARRLDEVQPYFDERGRPHSEQALAAAAVLLAQGNHDGARTRLGNYPAQLRGRLVAEPDNPWVWRDLAQMEAILGNADEALRCARKAVEIRPVSLDAGLGPSFRYALAVVYAWTGDKARAVAELADVLQAPGPVNVHELRSGPWFVSLRGVPAFEALLSDPKNNAPLF